MRIHSVRLTNFRNLDDVTVSLSARTLILGYNGQGKTNLLEAIYMLGMGRSFRDRRDANLMRFGQAYYRIEGIFWHLGVRNVVEVSYDGQEKRVRIDGKEARIVDLIGFTGVVLSAPEDIQLVKGPPSMRRLFLDMAISQVRRDYLSDLQRYSRVLSQRNNLLRPTGQAQYRSCYRKAWDEKLVEIASRIVEVRIDYLRQLEPVVDGNMKAISASGEVRLKYQPKGYWLESGVPVRDLLDSALASSSDLESKRGYTVVGPHADDFRIELNGSDLRIFGSEGEQRTAVLAIRCAEANLMRALIGRSPIILLDDVFAELDQERSAALASLISDFDQIILTSSRRSIIDGPDVSIVRVHEGKLV